MRAKGAVIEFARAPTSCNCVDFSILTTYCKDSIFLVEKVIEGRKK